MRRNRKYQDTHRILIKTAFDIMSASGGEDLSVSALARATGTNRTTIYYHFFNREDLLQAVHDQSSETATKIEPANS